MPGVFDYAAISRVQQANDIVDVVSEHVSLSKKGREMIGLCPFHEDHRPSLYVNPSKQIFKCFACSAGGDVLKFVQMRENLTFPQAVERLAERAGIQLKPVKRATARTDHQMADVDPNALARVNTWATKFFQHCLNDAEKGRVARDYLAQRNIGAESIEKWRLGLAPNAVDALAQAAASRKIPGELVKQGGLVAGANQDKFVNRLMFPITDVTGRVIGFGGRTLNDTGAKYINSPTTLLFDKSHTLYGLEQARHEIVATGTVVVVEGYTDVIMAHQFGCTNVVAALGTSFTSGHGRILRRYAKQVILVFDSDTAGMAAANRALEVCLSQRLDIKLGFLPEGNDPCDFLLVAGKEGFDRMVEQATDVLQYKWDRLKTTFETDESLAGRRAVLNEFLQAVATGLASNHVPVLENGILVNRLSRVIGLSAREINAELNRRIGRLSRSYGDVVSHVKDVPGESEPEQREVLEVLLNRPDLFFKYEGEIREDLFDGPVLRDVACALLDAIRSNEDFSINAVLARTESLEAADCIVELQRIGEEKAARQSYERRLSDYLQVLLRRKGHSGTVRTDRPGEKGNSVEAEGESAGRQNPQSIGMT